MAAYSKTREISPLELDQQLKEDWGNPTPLDMDSCKDYVDPVDVFRDSAKSASICSICWSTKVNGVCPEIDSHPLKCPKCGQEHEA